MNKDIDKNITRDIVFKMNAIDASPKGDTHLFLVGINQYEYCPKLRNCINDIVKFKELMLSKYGFKEELIVELTNEAATQENIIQTFRQLLEQVKPTDNLIIYFSGHGSYEALYEEGFWIPVEAKIGAIHQYIPNSTIQKILNAFKAHHIFLISDSCYAGALFTTYRSMEVAERLERHPSRWGLTSGRNEVVADGHGDNSPFSESLLYQLGNALGPIGVSELCNRVIETVISNENQTPQGEPLKVKGHSGGQFFFHPIDAEGIARQSLALPERHKPIAIKSERKVLLPSSIQLPILTLLYNKEDRVLVDNFKKHLKILALQQQVYLFDFATFQGTETENLDWLTHSKLILCLLSPSFFSNCYELAEKASALKKILIPIYLKNVPYETTFLGKLRGLPANRQFIANFPIKDAAYKEITEVIRNILT